MESDGPSGVLLIDKAQDMTSHDVVAIARRALNTKKIGQCGTLDPMATGLLMLVIGGVGWLYGGLLGAVAFKLMHDLISSITPQYWTFWIGLFLVVLVSVGREKFIRPWTWFKKEGAP
jgi:ABC-type branched-subunit amino acid transport system permease subunit